MASQLLAPSNIRASEENGLQEPSLKRKLLQRAKTTHGRIPGIKKVPLPAIGIIGLVALINLLVWAVCGIVLVSSRNLFLHNIILKLERSLTDFLSTFIRE